MIINNKTVQDLSINGKTVQSIKNLTTNKIIYTKTDDVQPIVYNPSFSFNTTKSTVTGSDLDPNYDYIIVERNEGTYDVLNSEKLETDTSFSLYDVEIYYYNPLETQQIIDSVLGEYFTFKGLYEEFPDILFYYGNLKDMIRIDNVSSTDIIITLHDFYDEGNYTCNVFDSNDMSMYSKEHVRTDPFSFQTSSKVSSITFPVNIYLYDSTMALLQTKTVEFEDNNENPN